MLIIPKVIRIPLATPCKFFLSLWASPCWICREGLSLRPRQGWLTINSSSLETVAMACRSCLPGTTSTILFVLRCSYRNRRFYTLVNNILSRPEMFGFFGFFFPNVLLFPVSCRKPILWFLDCSLTCLPKSRDCSAVQRDRTCWQHWGGCSSINPASAGQGCVLLHGTTFPWDSCYWCNGCVRGWFRGNRL